jgi:hypothetical protein
MADTIGNVVQGISFVFLVQVPTDGSVSETWITFQCTTHALYISPLNEEAQFVVAHSAALDTLGTALHGA